MLCRGTKSCFPLEAGSSISLACYPNWQLGILFGLRPKVLHMSWMRITMVAGDWGEVAERLMCNVPSQVWRWFGENGPPWQAHNAGWLSEAWKPKQPPDSSVLTSVEAAGSSSSLRGPSFPVTVRGWSGRSTTCPAGLQSRAQQSCGIYWRLLRQRLLPNFCTITLSWPVCWKWECLKDIGRWVCKGCQWNCPCSQSLLMSFAWPVGSGRQSSRLWRCRKGPVAGSRLIQTRATHRLCDVWSSWLCMDHCSAHGAPKAHECSSSVKPIRI